VTSKKNKQNTYHRQRYKQNLCAVTIGLHWTRFTQPWLNYRSCCRRIQIGEATAQNLWSHYGLHVVGQHGVLCKVKWWFQWWLCSSEVNWKKN